MVDEDSSHPELQPLSPDESAGKILASARMGWDLTIEEVADNLNLSSDTIRALERDDYDALPGYTFVKGYVRSYANLLRLNADELIASLSLEPEKLSEIPSTRSSIRQRGKTQKRSKSAFGKIFKWLLFLIILVVLGLFGLNQLAKLDTTEIAELFKLPSGSSESEQQDSEIIFPEASNEEAAGQDEDQKEALIRIE